MNSIKKLRPLALMVALSFAALGCVSVELRLKPEAAPQALGAFQNNGTVRLSDGH
jgi:hypothetical protein